MAVELKKSFGEKFQEHKALKIGGIISAALIITTLLANIGQIKDSFIKKEPQTTTVVSAEPDIEPPNNGGNENVVTEPVTTTTTTPTPTTTTTTTTTEPPEPEPVPLMNPYDGSDKNWYYELKDSAELGGIKYKNVPIMRNYGGVFIVYNLEGKYSKLTLSIGHVDGTDTGEKSDAGFEFYLDNRLEKEIKLNADELPVPVELNVTDCRQLKIVCNTDYSGADSWTFYGVINGTLYP